MSHYSRFQIDFDPLKNNIFLIFQKPNCEIWLPL